MESLNSRNHLSFYLYCWLLLAFDQVEFAVAVAVVELASLELFPAEPQLWVVAVCMKEKEEVGIDFEFRNKIRNNSILVKTMGKLNL